MQFFGYRSRSEAVADSQAHDHPSQADIKTAYDNGRRDERARHRRSPLLTLAVAVVALVGVGVLALAAKEGSFSRGGQVVDQNLAVVASQAAVAGKDAVSATGEAVRDAGTTVRDRAGEAG